MRVAIDAVGIREGGGAAVLQEMLVWLPKVRPHWHWTVYLMDRAFRSFDVGDLSPSVNTRIAPFGASGWSRLAWTNFALPTTALMDRADLLLSLANVAPRVSPVPGVVLVHQPKIIGDYKEKSWKARLRLGVLRHSILQGARGASRVVVQTDDMRRGLAACGAELDSKLVIIPSGYRTQFGDTSSNEDFEAGLGRLTGPKILYVSQARGHKDHATLLGAFRRLLSDYPSASLLLTVVAPGADVPQGAEATAEIHAKAKELGILDSVVWLGHLTPGEVQIAYHYADLQAFPSLKESFGLPLVEALSEGCPQAAVDLPYAHDVLGTTAEFFTPEDAESAKNAMVSLLGDRERREQLVQAGRERAQRFHYEAIAEQYCHVLEAAALGSQA